MTQIPGTTFHSQTIRANGIDLHVESAGEGPSILFLHGWPHTWRIWKPVMERLALTHRVIAPDLRGLGGSTKAPDGYDVQTQAHDMKALLDELGIKCVTAVGIDLGVQVAAMLALEHAHRVDGLVLMEGLLGRLPGAEGFLAKGPPWWFGLHATPGLAERVIAGNEAAYIDWFLINGTAHKQGIDHATRDAFTEAYRGYDALKAGFEHYRAFPLSADQIQSAVSRHRLLMPTLVIEGGVVGDAVTNQVKAISNNFQRSCIEDCGHLIPLEQPDILATMIASFHRTYDKTSFL